MLVIIALDLLFRLLSTSLLKDFTPYRVLQPLFLVFLAPSTLKLDRLLALLVWKDSIA
jgi:hypothetical protein